MCCGRAPTVVVESPIATTGYTAVTEGSTVNSSPAKYQPEAPSDMLRVAQPFVLHVRVGTKVPPANDCGGTVYCGSDAIAELTTSTGLALLQDSAGTVNPGPS